MLCLIKWLSFTVDLMQVRIVVSGGEWNQMPEASKSSFTENFFM